MYLQLFTFMLLTLGLILQPLRPLIAEESIDTYVTCAVYHRMMAGAMRRKGNVEALANAEIDKMNLFAERAKSLSHQEYGKDLGDDIFNEEWKAIQSDMTDQINRNYDNISRLRLRYKEGCNIGL